MNRLEWELTKIEAGRFIAEKYRKHMDMLKKEVEKESGDAFELISMTLPPITYVIGVKGDEDVEEIER